jgi:hypothetical protein
VWDRAHIGAARLLDRRSQNHTRYGIRIAPPFPAEPLMAKLKSAAKRELINTGKTTDQHRQDKRFVGRGANGQFKASDDVTLSLKRDRHGRQAEGDKQAGRLERHVRCSSSSRTDSDVPVRYWLLWCFRHYCSSSCAGAAVRQTPSDARQSSGRHERSRTHVGLGKDTPTRVLHSRDALCGMPGGLTRVAGLWRRHDLRVVSTCR